MAVDSVNSIYRKNLPKAARAVYKDQRERFWSSHRNSLLVQRKLETFAPWKRKIGYGPGLWTVFQLDNCPSFFMQHRTLHLYLELEEVEAKG